MRALEFVIQAVYANTTGKAKEETAATIAKRNHFGGKAHDVKLESSLAISKLLDSTHIAARMANLFRVMMHCVSANLLVRLRSIVEIVPEIAEDAGAEIPLEARSATEKRRGHTRRRRRDPLGQGHACTWRTHVIKVACRVIVRTRRVRVQISSSWPWAGYLKRVADKLSAYARLDLSGG